MPAQLYLTLYDPMDCRRPLPGSSVRVDVPGKNTGVGCHFLLQGIFLTQGWNLSLLHWQVGSLLLHHLGNSVKDLIPEFLASNKQFSEFSCPCA